MTEAPRIVHRRLKEAELKAIAELAAQSINHAASPAEISALQQIAETAGKLGGKGF